MHRLYISDCSAAIVFVCNGSPNGLTNGLSVDKRMDGTFPVHIFYMNSTFFASMLEYFVFQGCINSALHYPVPVSPSGVRQSYSLHKSPIPLIPIQNPIPIRPAQLHDPAVPVIISKQIRIFYVCRLF